jgi:type 2A phosphatase activator TIP41
VLSQLARFLHESTIQLDLAIMADSLSTPHHVVKTDASGKSISILDWEITVKTVPISNAGELDVAQAALVGLPLPEMTFGNNYLSLRNKKADWEYKFDTISALGGVRMGEARPGEPDVKVGYAKEWMQSRYGVTAYSAAQLETKTNALK